MFQNWPKDLYGFWFIGSWEIKKFWNKIETPFCQLFWFLFEWFFFLKKHRILRNLFFDKIFPRIHKNELTYKLCTILEWDKCQQFADIIKFVGFWFLSIQSCKTFVSFFFGPDSRCTLGSPLMVPSHNTKEGCLSKPLKISEKTICFWRLQIDFFWGRKHN